MTVVPTALKVRVGLRYLLTYPWASQAWQEVRGHGPWLLAVSAARSCHSLPFLPGADLPRAGGIPLVEGAPEGPLPSG